RPVRAPWRRLPRAQNCADPSPLPPHPHASVKIRRAPGKGSGRRWLKRRARLCCHVLSFVCREGFMRIALLVLVVFGVGAAAQAAERFPPCAVQKARDVGFRTMAPSDALEVAVGPGPCHTASLTIILRAKDDGTILYSYVAPLRRHIGLSTDDPDAFV